MVIDETIFQSIFNDLQMCHSLIHKFDLSREKNHPIQGLSEAFSLCSGAFYHLYLYHINYPDLFDNSKNENNEGWNIFSKAQNFQTFLEMFQPPSEIIKSDFRSMCIADAAFRLSAAGVLLCDVIQKIGLNDCEIGLSEWPYLPFFRPTPRDWERNDIYKKNRKCIVKIGSSEIQRNLALLVALRDEYGHSEFEGSFECRALIREKYYKDHIILAEMEMLQNCLALIRHLCENHKKKLLKV
jgi:hypothetical protein